MGWLRINPEEYEEPRYPSTHDPSLEKKRESEAKSKAFYEEYLSKKTESLAEEERENLRQEILKYAKELSEEEALDNIPWFLERAEKAGYLNRVLEWLKEYGFDKEIDPKIQAAAIEEVIHNLGI